MRVAAFTAFESVTDIAVQERPDPTPKAREAVVRVDAASLNHRALWYLKDESRGENRDLPFVTGGDLAGIVESTGDHVRNVSAGDRVVLCPLLTCGKCQFCRDGPENMCENYASYDGAFAEQALVRADRLVRLPEAVTTVDAATLPIAYMTAYRMLKRGETEAGDLVFIPGVTGGVGIAAVHLASIMGAQVAGSSRSRKKLERLESEGLDFPIHGDDPDTIHDAVAEIGAVDVVLNHLGGPFTRVGAKLLRTDGTMVMCGRTAGQYSEFDATDLYFGHKRIVGNTLGTQPDLEQVVAFLAEDRFDPVIANQYPLAETEQAFRNLLSGDGVGKHVIRPQR